MSLERVLAREAYSQEQGRAHAREHKDVGEMIRVCKRGSLWRGRGDRAHNPITAEEETDLEKQAACSSTLLTHHPQGWAVQRAVSHASSMPSYGGGTGRNTLREVAQPMEAPFRSRPSALAPTSQGRRLLQASRSSAKLRGSVKQHMDAWRQAGLTQLLEDPTRKLTYADVRTRLGLPSLVAAAA